MQFSHLATLINTGNSLTYDFGDVTVPEDGLVIVVVSRGGANVAALDSVSIGGNAAAIAVATASNRSATGIAYLAVTAGARNVTAVFTGTNGQSAQADVYLLTDAPSDTPSDTDSEIGTGESADMTLDFPTSGIAVYGVTHLGTAGDSFSRAIVTGTSQQEGAQRYTSAMKVADETGDTETASWSGSTIYGAVAAVWALPGGGGGVSRNRSILTGGQL